MEITLTIPEAQWQQFQQLAQEAVEEKWNGSYEDFATYIMMVNLENYIESQKRKQEKQMKRALAEYEESLKKEANGIRENPPPVPPVEKKPEDKPKTTPMTNKELSARIAEL